MKNRLIATRYAQGLGMALDRDSDLETVLHGLQRFADLLERHEELRAVLLNPSLNRKMRVALLEGVCAHDETPVSAVRLLDLMLRRGRLVYTRDVAEIFEQIVDERLNRVEAWVTTAIPLTEDLEERLRQGLAHYSGKAVRMDLQVDPRIIDGVVVRMGEQVIDGSLYTQLERLKETLLTEEMVFDETRSD
ncbi:MAG: ATP synthase F1 subunit delta [Candidatus Hydrogenedentota bacterium]